MADAAASSNNLGLAVWNFIGFELKKYTAECVEGKFVVSENSSQPFGVLHGGISAFLSEAVASMGAQIASNWQRVAGIELNINHLRSANIGQEVYVVGKPLLTGKRVQVWEVKFTSKKDAASVEPYVVAVSRVTVLVGLPDPSKGDHFKQLARL